DIGADLDDLETGFAECQQQAMGLNGPREADGLVGAVGQQVFKGIFVLWGHISTSLLSSQRSKQSNVAWAAMTTASRSSLSRYRLLRQAMKSRQRRPVSAP